MSDSEKSDDETRRLPIGEARIEQRDGEAWLVVSGEALCANMEVTLEPAVYVVQPDWWQVTLIGTLPGGLCLTSIRPYEAARPVRTIAGKQGIVLLGADDESRRFAL